MFALSEVGTDPLNSFVAIESLGRVLIKETDDQPVVVHVGLFSLAFPLFFVVLLLQPVESGSCIDCLSKSGESIEDPQEVKNVIRRKCDGDLNVLVIERGDLEVIAEE